MPVTPLSEPRSLAGRLDLTPAALLQAAVRVVEDKGLAGLSLRPLAQQLGVSVTAVTSRFGAKAGILVAICTAAAAEEAAILEGWRQRIGDARGLSPDAVADIADGVIDELFRAVPGVARLQCEIVQAAAWQPELRDSLERWLALRADFWAAIVARADTVQADLAVWLHAYAIDELGHTVALGSNPHYRWLRKLCLRRLCRGVFADPLGWDAQSFDAVRTRLGSPADTDVRYRVAHRSNVAAEVSRHIADLLLEGGGEAVTHRSVGARADMPATTLVYHFPRQTDLLKAGLEELILSAHAGADRRQALPDRADEGMDMIVATFAVALAAARLPELLPFAEDMRRRRGENGYVELRRISPHPERVDMLAAQSLSVAASGAILLQRARGEKNLMDAVAPFFDVTRQASSSLC